MTNVAFAGFVFDDSGTAVNGATVKLYDRNTVTPAIATTTTNSSGYWTISRSPDNDNTDRYDVEVTSGSSKRRRKYDDALQVVTLEAGSLRLRGSNNEYMLDFSSTPTADRSIIFPDRAGQVPVGNMSWATVAGDGTLQSNSYNVSGVARGSTGVYTVSWDTNFANTNYACMLTLEAQGYGGITSPAVDTIGVRTYNTSDSLTDIGFHIVAMGDR